MAEIVNLRRFKKQRTRAEAAEMAAQNRVRHGRTGERKRIEQAAAERRAAILDGAKLEVHDVSEQPEALRDK